MSASPKIDLLAFPHPPTQPDQLSAAVFLYFEEPIFLPLPPVSVLPCSEWFFKEVFKLQEAWRLNFDATFAMWRIEQQGFANLCNLLGPLNDIAYKTMWLAYPATRNSLERAQDLIDSSGMKTEEIDKIIDGHAAGELIRHLAVEEAATALLTQKPDVLFDYCAQVFSCDNEWMQTSRRAYFLRLLHLDLIHKMSDRLLLTNSRLAKFFDALPCETTNVGNNDLLDVLAWELFRQILSPYLDPLCAESVARILAIRSEHKDALKSFRTKCQGQAKSLPALGRIEEIPTTVASFVQDTVSKELSEILSIDRDAIRKLVTELASSKETWIGTGLFLQGLLGGGEILTSAGAIAAIGTFGAKALKAASERREKLRSNDYKIVYLIHTGKV